MTDGQDGAKTAHCDLASLGLIGVAARHVANLCTELGWTSGLLFFSGYALIGPEGCPGTSKRWTREAFNSLDLTVPLQWPCEKVLSHVLGFERDTSLRSAWPPASVSQEIAPTGPVQARNLLFLLAKTAGNEGETSPSRSSEAISALGPPHGAPNRELKSRKSTSCHS